MSEVPDMVTIVQLYGNRNHYQSNLLGGIATNDNPTCTSVLLKDSTTTIPECTTHLDCNDNDICTQDTCDMDIGGHVPMVPDQCLTNDQCTINTCTNNACGTPMDITCDELILEHNNCLAHGTCNSNTGQCDYTQVDPMCGVTSTDPNTNTNNSKNNNNSTSGGDGGGGVVVCGDKICSPGEDCETCPEDCRSHFKGKRNRDVRWMCCYGGNSTMKPASFELRRNDRWAKAC